MRPRLTVRAWLALPLMFGCSDLERPRDVKLDHLAPDPLVLAQGQSATVVPLTGRGDTILASDVRFYSADTKTATIDSTGEITARGHAGSTRVMAVSGVITAEAAVIVTPVLTRMAVEPDSVVIRTGRSVRVRAWGVDLAGDTLTIAATFEAPLSPVAWIDGDGTIHGYQPGQITLAVRATSPSQRRYYQAVPITVTPDSGVLVHTSLPGAQAWDIVVGPDGATYISLPVEGTVIRLEPDRYNVTRQVRLGSRPTPLALDSTGSTLYVGLLGAGQIVVLDPTTLTERRRFPVSQRPRSIVLDESNGSLHAVTMEGSLLRVTLPDGIVVDSATVGESPSVGLSGDGATALVVTRSAPTPEGGPALLVFNASNYREWQAFPIGPDPCVVASPPGSPVAVAGYLRGIDVINLRTGQRESAPATGYVCGLAFSPNASRLYAVEDLARMRLVDFPLLSTTAYVFLWGNHCRLAVDRRNGRVLIPSYSDGWAPAWLDVIQR